MADVVQTEGPKTVETADNPVGEHKSVIVEGMRKVLKTIGNGARLILGEFSRSETDAGASDGLSTALERAAKNARETVAA